MGYKSKKIIFYTIKFYFFWLSPVEDTTKRAQVAKIMLFSGYPPWGMNYFSPEENYVRIPHGDNFLKMKFPSNSSQWGLV